MRKWLLTLLLCCTGGVARADEQPRTKVDAGDFLMRLAVVPKRVTGRVLGLLIHKGMTEAQVVKILGEYKGLPTGGVAGGLCFCWYDYPEYGLTISLSTHVAGAGLEVDGISSWSLLDPVR
jgi:hypothetical protein